MMKGRGTWGEGREQFESSGCRTRTLPSSWMGILCDIPWDRRFGINNVAYMLTYLPTYDAIRARRCFTGVPDGKKPYLAGEGLRGRGIVGRRRVCPQTGDNRVPHPGVLPMPCHPIRDPTSPFTAAAGCSGPVLPEYIPTIASANTDCSSLPVRYLYFHAVPPLLLSGCAATPYRPQSEGAQR